MYEKIILVSGPVIVKDNKVLLDISSKDDFWKFCGGQVREHETLQETAIRRANEELGINTEIIDSSPFLLHLTKKKNNVPKDVILVHWLAKADEEITPGKDVKEWQWMTLKDLKKHNIGPNIVPTLKHFGFIQE